MPKLILASTSERRLSLLRQIGLQPTVQAIDIDESPQPQETAAEMVQRLAREKAAAAMAGNEVVVAADTVATLSGTVFGKPESQDHAIDMLLSLAGKTHSVITGVCVRSAAETRVIAVTTDISMGPITRLQALDYWETGESAGKAGSFAIQGRGALFVTSLQGSYSNVVGLPLYETARLLELAGIPLFASRENNEQEQHLK